LTIHAFSPARDDADPLCGRQSARKPSAGLKRCIQAKPSRPDPRPAVGRQFVPGGGTCPSPHVRPYAGGGRSLRVGSAMMASTRSRLGIDEQGG
jgi:hypothetical protein